jgi:hypothetical protein
MVTYPPADRLAGVALGIIQFGENPFFWDLGKWFFLLQLGVFAHLKLTWHLVESQ